MQIALLVNVCYHQQTIRSGARWLMDASDKELVIVLAVMVGLLVFGIVAVVIFVRVWRKERK